MNREDWIGAYLAGALRGDKLKDFEKQLKNDPVLQVEVDAVKSFINTVDDEKDFPVVLEIIKETDNAFNEQPSKTELLKIVGLIVGVVLLIILSLFFLNKNDSTDKVVINNETVYAANFKDFINDKYEDNAHFLDVNSNRKTGLRFRLLTCLLKV